MKLFCILKQSTPDMINRETVVLQSHADMVHEKNNDVEFDFLNSGIKMYIDGDWVKADGTTLGADNGLGVPIMGIWKAQKFHTQILKHYLRLMKKLV